MHYPLFACFGQAFIFRGGHVFFSAVSFPCLVLSRHILGWRSARAGLIKGQETNTVLSEFHPMAYALQSLLRIRALREERAGGELTLARQAVAVAQEALDARRRDLADYESTREERRDRIYDTVMGRPVSREQLDLAQEGVARIDEEGILKADNVKRAETDLRNRETAAEAAKAVFIAASKNRMKIDEHRDAWLLEETAFQERRAEGELEDFTGRKQNLDD